MLGASPPAGIDEYLLHDHAAQQPASPWSGLRWRMLGPFRGGRVDAVTGVPGRPNEFYFGAVNGGVWKSIDAGRVWTPVFDSQPVASIGAIAVAPSAPDVVYVGSGESTLRDSTGYGNGMYKSTDAGRSWTHIGLDDTQHIGKIAVDPRNPNVVFVAAIGHLYAPSAERGVFRTIDGGKSWQKVLYKDENVGAVEVVIDPTNSRVVYAGLWNTRRPPWYTYAPTNGPGGGIFKSIDGGTTWKQLTDGLPKEGIGKTGIAVAAEQPAARVCGGRLPRAGGAPRRRAAPTPLRAAGRARWRRRWRRRSGAGSGRLLPFRRCRRDVDPGFVRQCAVGTRLVLRAHRRRSEGRRHRLRAQRRGQSHEGRRQDVGRAARIARRRRLSPGVGLARRFEHGDRRERSGGDHHSQREGRRPDDRDVEFVAQPADGADLPRLGRLPLSVLGHRCAAGQRQRRGVFAREVRRDLDARLGTDRRRSARAA